MGELLFISVVIVVICITLTTGRLLLLGRRRVVEGWGVIDSIKKTSFVEGDVLVLTTEANLTMDQASRIREDVNRSLPEGVKAVLLEGGLQLSVLTKEEN